MRFLPHTKTRLRPVQFRLHVSGIPLSDPFPRMGSKAPKMFKVNRESYETLLRRLVVKYRPNVQLVTGTVTGYNKKEDGSSRLQGVNVRTHGGEMVEAAVFVVGKPWCHPPSDVVYIHLNAADLPDATGPSQHSIKTWLNSAGFTHIPPSIRVQYDPHLHYCHTAFPIPPELHSKIDKILPHGFKQGLAYTYGTDWSTGEREGILVGVFENSERTSYFVL